MIGLAYKPLDCSWRKAQKLERQVVECELVFLGLIALENKLKPESASECQVKCLMYDAILNSEWRRKAISQVTHVTFGFSVFYLAWLLFNK